MDFFERWFGSSPDAGDGSFELLLIAFVVLLVCAVVATLRRRQPRSRASAPREGTARPSGTRSEGLSNVELGHVRDQGRAAR